MRNKDQNLPGGNMSFKKIREFTLAMVARAERVRRRQQAASKDKSV
jgi:hypothetical protein